MMKNKQKLKRSLKKWIAGAAIAALLSSLVLALAIPTSQAALDLNLNAGGLEEALCAGLGEGGVISCGTDSATSFTNFEGSFTPPESAGYAEGITQTSSAREFVVNVTNFVLSFLGLAAVVVIIYGGFMYVTAAGEQERADKGKKSVMYAVIGIIIVLISFALVNTIITGAAGGSDKASSGLYASGATGESLTELQSAQVAKHIQELTQDFVKQYTSYANTVAIVEAMLEIDDFNKQGLRDFEEGFNAILKQADPFSATADSAKAGLRLLKPYVSLNLGERVKNLATHSDWMQTGVLSASTSVEGGNVQLAAALSADEKAICTNACSGFLIFPPAFGACMADCAENPEKELFAYSEELAQRSVDPNNISQAMIAQVVATSESSFTDFSANMLEIVGDFEDLTLSFTEQTTLSSLLEGDSGIVERLRAYTTKDGFTIDGGTKQYLPGAAAYSTTHTGLPTSGSREVSDVVSKMNQLYGLVKNLKFTTAVIKANTKQGNAPLTVTVNGLDSSDPSNATITPDQYAWDLLGDGFTGASEDNKSGPNATFTYTEPGTYRVGLRVTSSDPANIASGISYLSIKVSPPSSIIALTTKGGLSAVEQDMTDRNRVSFTGEDAKAGITFDASGTTDGDGNKDTLVDFAFDFGDGEKSNGETPIVTHYYTKEGTYRFQLEVTDQNGIKDRKRLTIVVASPAAHLEASVTHADIGQSVLFDASASLTDFGSINNYAWTIKRGTDVVLENSTGQSELSNTFSQPGQYVITVQVTDSSGQSNATSVPLQVSSSKPVPAFSYRMKDPARPNIVELDASASYDPDEGDTLTYEWKIDDGATGTFTFLDGTTASSKKPVIEFLTVGDHDVTLNVSDQYEGDLKQSEKLSKKVNIQSLLGIGVKNKGSAALLLNQEGKAKVDLELSTNTGVAFEIDWADGSEKESIGGTGVSTAGTIFRVWGSATHDYTQAGTYPVKITVLDSENRTNILTRNIYIGNGTEPIPVIKVYIDNQEVGDPNHITANRTNTIKFDAGSSLDLNGQPIGQTSSYSWVLGDGARATGKELTKKYTETGEFVATLTVRSIANASVSSSTTIKVSIIETPPRIAGLTVQPQREQMTTPLVVKATVNASDDDGKIMRYKFWYYDVNNSSITLGEQISLSAQTFLTINTSGTTGDVNEYAFAVEVTDNENNTVSSLDELPTGQIPTLEVENGPNKAPVAEFKVDRTNVMVNESVTFTSNSKDEDGRIVEYIWDVEGDGFFNNPAVRDSTIVHEYSSTAAEGIQVRLKVTDDTGATAVSSPVRIFIDSLTADPTAAFRYQANVLSVTFMNNSSADTANNARLVGYQWDFDTSIDADGDGDGGNDVDSTEQNPKFTYETFGRHTVKLIVTDNEGNTDTVSNTIELVEVTPPKAAFRFTVVEGKNVQFDNASTAGSADAPLDTYAWDFDGDNVTDSVELSPRYAYTSYGTYNVRLVVTDTLGRSAESKKRINVEQPKAKALEAYLTTQPAGDPKRGGDIYLVGTAGNITFSFRSQNAQGKVSYCIDKNVFYDTDGNGKKDDDCDHKATEAGSWTTGFNKEWGTTVVKLTATDELKRTYTVTKQIFFETTPPIQGGASILPVTNAEALYILATALGFTMLGAKYYTRKEENDSTF